jgi:hypothetical protein
MLGKGGPGSPDDGLGKGEGEGKNPGARDDKAPPSGQPSPGSSSTVARGRDSSGPAVDRNWLSGDEAVPPRKTERARPRRSRAPAPPEPAQMLDLGELPETYGKDEVGILTKDPVWYFVYWEVTEAGEVTAREQLGLSGEEARLMLRLFITLPAGPAHGTGGGQGHSSGRETRELRDVALPQRHGRKYLEAPRPGALVRAAVGLLSSEGYFAPIAHSALVRMPPQQPAAQASIEWLHVLPVRSDGQKRERIVATPPSAPHQEPPLPIATTATGSGPLADASSSAGQGRGRRADRGKGAGPGPGNGSGGLA